jgi:hypothetical protein
VQSTRATQAPMYNSVKVANVRVRVGLVVKPERGGGLLHGAGQRHGVGRGDCRQTANCREVKLPALPANDLGLGLCRAVPAEALHLPALPQAM